jgi:hypothetical protein
VTYSPKLGVLDHINEKIRPMIILISGKIYILKVYILKTDELSDIYFADSFFP